MRYRVRDAPALLRTPLGRRQLWSGCYYRAWPALGRVAQLHRSTLGRRTRVVAVVGSFGKTTTARAVSAALGRDPDELGENFASYVAAAVLDIRRRDRHAVIEVGISAGGQMTPYARVLQPQVVVVTGVGSEHNRSLPTLEATRDEKAEMVRALPASGHAVLNGDDTHARWMASQTDARITTFGFGPGNDVRAENVALDWPSGTEFTLSARGHEHRSLRIRLLGRPAVLAALAAVAVALAEDVPLETVAARLDELAPAPGRFEPLALPDGAFLLRDDYKSGLETIDAALDLLAEIPARRRIVVLGDIEEPPGKQGPVYRYVGARLAAVADHVVFTTSRKRPYTAGARDAGTALRYTRATGGVLDAIAAIRRDLRPGDVVLVKGRSTERLERVALGLAGRQVRCNLRMCPAIATRCGSCPMLERGWQGRRVVL